MAQTLEQLQADLASGKIDAGQFARRRKALEALNKPQGISGAAHEQAPADTGAIVAETPTAVSDSSGADGVPTKPPPNKVARQVQEAGDLIGALNDVDPNTGFGQIIAGAASSQPNETIDDVIAKAGVPANDVPLGPEVPVPGEGSFGPAPPTELDQLTNDPILRGIGETIGSGVDAISGAVNKVGEGVTALREAPDLGTVISGEVNAPPLSPPPDSRILSFDQMQGIADERENVEIPAGGIFDPFEDIGDETEINPADSIAAIGPPAPTPEQAAASRALATPTAVRGPRGVQPGPIIPQKPITGDINSKADLATDRQNIRSAIESDVGGGTFADVAGQIAGAISGTDSAIGRLGAVGSQLGKDRIEKDIARQLAEGVAPEDVKSGSLGQRGVQNVRARQSAVAKGKADVEKVAAETSVLENKERSDAFKALAEKDKQGLSQYKQSIDQAKNEALQTFHDGIFIDSAGNIQFKPGPEKEKIKAEYERLLDSFVAAKIEAGELGSQWSKIASAGRKGETGKTSKTSLKIS